MKNRLLSLLIIGSSLGLTAQKQVKPQNEPGAVRQVEANTQPTVPYSPASVNITFLDTFYLNDFSDSTLFTESAPPNASSQWVFRTSSVASNGFFGTFNSTTASNGYAMFNFFGFNNNPAQFANASITVGPIDLSAATAPLSVNFEQYYAKFRDSAQVFYSLDGISFQLLGGNTDMPLYGVNQQGQTIGFVTDNGELKSIFADQLAGQPQVWLRFRYKSDFGGYTWLVDDLTITSVSIPETDVALNTLYTTDNLLLDYNIIPLAQADSLVYGVILENNGSGVTTCTINYEVLLNGSSVSTGSDEVILANTFGGRDTFYFMSNYILSQIGQYTFNATITTPGTDFTPNNNTLSSTFEVSDYVYSQLANLNGVESTTLSGAQAPYNAYRVGDFFYARNSDAMYAVNIAVPRPVGTQNFPLELTIEVYNSQDLNNLVNIVDYVLDNTHPLGITYKTILFDPPVEMPADNLFIVAMSTTDETKPFRFYARNDGDPDESTRAFGPYGANGAINWFRGWTFTPGIQVITNPDIAGVKPTEAGVDVMIYPNPANQFINMRMVSANATDAQIRLTDIQGRIVMEESKKALTESFDSFPVGHLANGVYTLQISTNKGVASRKIVIAH